MGTDSVRKGILVATTERMVFYAKKMGGFEFESYPYDKLSSFERGKSMMGGTTKFVVSGNTVSMKWIKDKSLDELVSVVHGHMSSATHDAGEPREAPAPPLPSTDVGDQFSVLAQLHEKGILTDEEYSTKKAELLSRM
jgi:hypothetical protein